ncbi:peptidyl-prolyl cis-trans isomerase [Nonomuraea aurantiaca]|uniref:peptidyl-prolyl cis-trans isomerase n=1 Tax=Nonomuraea aurantiaca TaxID=2878562 RepID=UPI001CD92AD9|nr:peptidyl-prolyl cis-trans isomerase [Nonomuraea aurantiaca]MCA2224351.1 peptidyl-prolyl cis-trans isomerase [Nonomuraea aurantiaca]
MNHALTDTAGGPVQEKRATTGTGSPVRELPGATGTAGPVRERPAATGAATAPDIGAVIGWVGGRPISREPLDRRVRELRDSPLSAALPQPGSSEDRQLARWLTQVILTEALCEDEAAARGLSPVEVGRLDPLAAVELGSINASAYNGSPWVRALFEHLTATVEVPPEWRSPTRAQGAAQTTADGAAQATAQGVAWHVVRHRVFADRAEAAAATADDLEPLGPVTLGSLPAAIADAIPRRPYGMLVGPVEDALGWHVAVAHPAPTPSPSPGAVSQREAARRRMFARWLDESRAAKVELVPGLEHPGDPRQPDNHHKH